MLEHYFHESYQFRTKRRNLREFKMNASKVKSSDQSEKFVCMSNGNAIEIYKITAQSVDFCMRKEFFCNIAKLQVIPSLHHDSDYIFILDDLGRFSFWRPSQGLRQTCNVIQKQNTNKRFYREQLSPEEEEEFSGSAFRFDVKDTVGHIFFTVQNKLTILSVSVKSRQGLRINNTRTYEIPYTRFRYVNCLNITGAKFSQVFIGIIQQLEQKTILKIHVLDLQVSSTMIDQESLSYKIQKTNLLSFESGQNDEIIVLTYDQISLYKFKQSQYLCNYRTRGNYGSICYISPTSHKAMHEATYIHLGYDLTVFTKSRLHSYGPLKLDGKNLLQNRGILQSKYLGHVSGGEVMLGFVTNFNEVFFILLYENKWKLIRQIQSLSSIFSMHELNRQENDSSMVVVHASQQSSSQITHVQITSPTILDQEQIIQNELIETIDLVEDGQSLIVSSDGQSSLLTWDQQTNHWVQHFDFNKMKEQILACTGIHVVMTSGIYKYEISQSNELTMTQLLKEENILSAVANKQYIGYYTSEGNYKFYEFQSNSVARIRKNCIEEYIWHMLSGKNILVTAAYNEPGELRILPIQKVAKKILLQTKELVSSISSISYPADKINRMVDQSSQNCLWTDLIVGFHNGDVEIFSLDEDKTIAKFNLGSQMVNVASYRSTHAIVYTSSRQFILSRHCQIQKSLSKKTQQDSMKQGPLSPKYEYKIHQVQFSDNSQQISKVLYLPRFDKFLTLLSSQSCPQSSLIQLRSLKLHKKLSDSELTLELKSSISMKTIFKTQKGEDIPFVEVHDDEFVYIALPEHIFKYCIKTKQLIKKQLHLLKQIAGIEKIEAGILVTGVDVMQAGSVVLFDYDDLSIKGTYNLGTSRPSCIKSFKNSPKYPNRFLIQHETYLTLFETQPTYLITSLKTVNTKTLSSTIDLNEKYNKILLTDQYRYLSVWDYDLEVVSQDFVPVSKYFGAYTINDCCWLDGAVVTGDRGGNLALLEFNLGNVQDLHKMNMTKVAAIYVGQQIFTLRRVELSLAPIQQDNESDPSTEPLQHPSRSLIYYGTSSGTIGTIKTITQQQFKLLKQIELDTIQYIDIKEHFSYEQWRKRIPKDDKMIDSSVIKYYLEEFRMKIKVSQEDFYNDVTQVYQRLVGGVKGKGKGGWGRKEVEGEGMSAVV